MSPAIIKRMVSIIFIWDKIILVLGVVVEVWTSIAAPALS